jgi:hypothetical protein
MEPFVCDYSVLCSTTLKPTLVPAKADDEVLASALRSYHRELLTNNKKISARLKSDHGIEMRYSS